MMGCATRPASGDGSILLGKTRQSMWDVILDSGYEMLQSTSPASVRCTIEP